MFLVVRSCKVLIVRPSSVELVFDEGQRTFDIFDVLNGNLSPIVFGTFRFVVKSSLQYLHVQLL